jgi:hypothetical protein
MSYTIRLLRFFMMKRHENMCIMNRPFAIEQVTSWPGMDKSTVAVMRELVDVM